MSSPGEDNDELTEYERMCKALQERKNVLFEQKKTYSTLTSTVYNSNQEVIKIQKAIKNEISKINAATKKYVDTHADIALVEADCEYYRGIVASHAADFDEEKELSDIGLSREELQRKLNEYRELKDKINNRRKQMVSQNQSLQQECLNVGFFCKDIRSKMDSEIRRNLERHNFDPNNSTKKHIRNANKSAMTVANRVLDCREEVLGFFKQQILKVKREERLAQEEREMLAKQKISKEDSEAMTEDEVDAFVKKQKIFPAKDENSNENTDQDSPVDMQPKPPSSEIPTAVLNNLTNNLMGRGNFLGGTARQRRKERGSLFSSVNIDRIGEELIRACETEGNTSKLRALKQSMKNHVLYQISLILLLEHELNSEALSPEQLQKEYDECNDLNSRQEGRDSDPTRGRGKGFSRAMTGGQFGQNLGKLCGLTAAESKNQEGYITPANSYIELLAEDIAKVEADLVLASAACEDMLYKTCVDGIDNPWDPSVLSGKSVEEKESVAESPVKDVKGKTLDAVSSYRAQSMISLRSRISKMEKKDESKLKKNNKPDMIEKDYGLAQWVHAGSLETKLSEILSADLKSMEDVPIELGLAKLTSIVQTAKHVTLSQIQTQKDRERQTLALALTHLNQGSEPPKAAPIVVPPPERKVCIQGLEKL